MRWRAPTRSAAGRSATDSACSTWRPCIPARWPASLKQPLADAERARSARRGREVSSSRSCRRSRWRIAASGKPTPCCITSTPCSRPGEAHRRALHDESSQFVATMHFALADVASQLPARSARRDPGGPRDCSTTSAAPAQLSRTSCGRRSSTTSASCRRSSSSPTACRSAGACRSPCRCRWPGPAGDGGSDAVSHGAGSTDQRGQARAGDAGGSLAWSIRPHRVKCSISDDGVGCDAARKAPGSAGPRDWAWPRLRSAWRRFGGIVSLRHERRRSHGTDLTVEIPLER